MAGARDGRGRRRQRAGRLDHHGGLAAQTLSAPGENARLPRVSVDAEGNAVFTWVRWDGANWRVQTRARSATGERSRVQTLSPAGQDGYWPELAIDAEGNAVFAWAYRADGTSYRVQTRRRSRTGELSRVRTISPPGDANGPHVAVDSGGNAVFAWYRFDGAAYRIQTRSQSAAGELSGVQTLSAPGQHAFSPRVALDAPGNAAFTWHRFDGSDYRAQARTRSTDGVLTATETLSAAGGSVMAAAVGVDADGDAVFSWLRSEGSSSRLQARARGQPPVRWARCRSSRRPAGPPASAWMPTGRRSPSISTTDRPPSSVAWGPSARSRPCSAGCTAADGPGSPQRPPSPWCSRATVKAG